MVDGKKFDIIEIPTPSGPFLVMETLSRERNLVTGVFILDMNEQTQFQLVKFIFSKEFFRVEVIRLILD